MSATKRQFWKEMTDPETLRQENLDNRDWQAMQHEDELYEAWANEREEEDRRYQQEAPF